MTNKFYPYAYSYDLWQRRLHDIKSECIIYYNRYTGKYNSCKFTVALQHIIRAISFTFTEQYTSYCKHNYYKL